MHVTEIQCNMARGQNTFRMTSELVHSFFMTAFLRDPFRIPAKINNLPENNVWA